MKGLQVVISRMLARTALVVASSALRVPRLARVFACAPSYPATDALYLQDSELLHARATVLGLENDDKGWSAVLDATPFHPQGGGQPADLGTINDQAIVGCFADGRAGSGGVIFHALEGKPSFATGDEVVCQVDGERRRRSARVHSAGHLVDAAMQRCGVELVAGKGYHFPDGAQVQGLGEEEGAPRLVLGERCVSGGVRMAWAWFSPRLPSCRAFILGGNCHTMSQSAARQRPSVYRTSIVQ